MSTQDNLTNAFIRHQVFVQRFGAKVGNDFISTMIDLQEAAEDRLLNSDLTDFQRERLELIARDLEAQFRASVSESAQERINELREFAEYEAEFSHGLLETNISGSTTLPSPAQISAAIDFAKMDVTNSGLGIRQIFTGFTDRAAKQVAREITEGAVLGETNKQIADRLQRLNGLHKNQATTITRTVTNNVSSIARDEVMRANEDVLDGYEWVAALDNRTTLVCASRDGQVYKFSDPEAPRPPAHFNCRSTIVPKVKPEFDLGADVKTTRPSIGDDGAELIDADTNYEKWLRKQPAKFQDEILGKERGKLFRNKGIKLDRFIDANGNPIPLDQLKVLDESFNIKAKTTDIADSLLSKEMPKSVEFSIPERRGDLITPEFINEVDEMGRIFENEKTARYVRLANYNEQPTVVSEIDFENIKGDTLYRGITDYENATGKQLIDQYFDDEHFVGDGVFGSGTYSSYGPSPNMPKATGYDVASTYAYSNGSGAIFRFKLKPNAKVYNYRENKPYDIVDEALEKLGFESEAYLERQLINAKAGDDIGLINQIRSRIKQREEIEVSLAADTSRAAIIAGYDAVNIVENNYMVVLNRGAVVTDKKVWELD